MVEDRIVWAFLIIAMMALGVGWLTMRKLIERKEFQKRQTGRYKTSKANALEPAE